MEPFKTTRIVEYAHTDMAGIVHFSEFFRYMEAAEHEFFRSIGVSVSWHDPEGRHLSWPRVSCSFDFKQPLRFENEFTIELSVARLGTSSVTFHADFLLDAVLMAAGKSTSVCCELSGADGKPQSMRSVDIPGEIRKELERIQRESP